MRLVDGMDWQICLAFLPQLEELSQLSADQAKAIAWVNLESSIERAGVSAAVAGRTAVFVAGSAHCQTKNSDDYTRTIAGDNMQRPAPGGAGLKVSLRDGRWARLGR